MKKNIDFIGSLNIPEMEELFRIMKLTSFFLLISVVSVLAGKTYSQTKLLSLNMEKTAVKEVLSKIEDQSEFYFMYSEKIVDVNREVSVNVENQKIETVLNSLFAGTNVDYAVNDRIIVLATPEVFGNTAEVAFQQKTVTGRVIDSENQPLPGVTVVIKGTTQGTVTNVDGNYSLSGIPDGAILQFSFVGMKAQEITPGDKNVIDVVMESETVGIDDVVVTALGISKTKKSIGYAITEMEGQEFATFATKSPVDALAGKVSGVQVDNVNGGTFGANRINIRGISTLGGNNQPIFVIDGVIMENSTVGYSGFGNELKNLNIDDFESVSVLKGAAATALYGSRAINGVVQITSKKGKKQNGIGITVKQSNAWRNALGPDFQNEFGAGPPALPSWTKRPIDGENTSEFEVNSAGEPFPNGWNVASWGPRMEGQQVRDYDGSWTTFDPQPDNFKDAFDTGFYNNTNISFNGGTDKFTYYTSLSYVDEKGVEIGNNMNMTTLNSRFTYDISSWLTADVAFTLTSNSLINPPTHRMAYGFGYDYWPRSFNTKKWRYNYKAPHGGLARTDLGDIPNAPGNNVWFDKYENTYEQNEKTYRTVVNFNARINEQFDVVIGANNYDYNKLYQKKELGSGYKNEGGSYQISTSAKNQTTFKAMVNFKDQYGDFDVAASIGGETWEQKGNWTDAWTNGGLVVPGNYNLSNGKQTNGVSGGINNTKTINSVYAYANIGWKNQLFIDITGRNDWSSALTYVDGSGTNSYFYPSVSTSWVFSESFKLPSWVTFGKLRASWANVGNDTQPYFINSSYSRTAVLKTWNGDVPAYTSPNYVLDPNIKPEQKKSWEIGTNVAFFQGRINLDVALYNESISEQIVGVQVPIISGVSSIKTNGGELENSGWEIELNTTPLKGKDWEWNLNIMASHNETKLVSLYPGITRVVFSGNPDNQYGEAVVANIGGAYGDIMTRRAYKPYQAKDAQGNPIDHPNNGISVLSWSDSDQAAYYQQADKGVVIGNIQPDLLGNISTGFRWKSIDVSALFDYRIGGDVFCHGAMYNAHFGTLESTLINRSPEVGGIEWTSKRTGNTYGDGYIPNGVFADGTLVNGKNVGGMLYQDAFEQGLVEPTHWSAYNWALGDWGKGISEEFTYENTYMGVKEIEIGYTLPRNWVSKASIQDARISVYGRDLGYIYSKIPDNLNPALNSNESYEFLAPGITPRVSSLGFNLQLTF